MRRAADLLLEDGLRKLDRGDRDRRDADGAQDGREALAERRVAERVDRRAELRAGEADQRDRAIANSAASAYRSM